MRRKAFSVASKGGSRSRVTASILAVRHFIGANLIVVGDRSDAEGNGVSGIIRIAYEYRFDVDGDRCRGSGQKADREEEV